MGLAFRILRAAHARGTHQKLALDALHRMRRPDAAQWERLFLKHAELYATGAKAPDDEFKDFKNHVLHPRDEYWGGAPEKVESWYGHLVDALRAGQWSEAVWCAGVLSHYATDPVHPFHTAQSEAENGIHRAVEWSISRSYDALWSAAMPRHADLDVAMPVGPHWIKDAVCAAADRANAGYEKLIAHYDIHRGVVSPPDGLDVVSRALVGELLVYAATLHARFLDRAITDAGVAPPDVSLGLETIVATLKLPLKVLLKRLADAEDRRLVEDMYDELKATGRVDATLPEDDRVVRDLHAAEVLVPRAKKSAEARQARLPAAPEAAAAARRLAETAAVKIQIPAAIARDVPGLAAVRLLPPTEPLAPEPPAASDARRSLQEQLASVPLIPRSRAAPSVVGSVPDAPAAREPLSRLSPRGTEGQSGAEPAGRHPSTEHRPLAAGDDLEAAPSIGPKTAERFAMAGIRTVADFLAADPDATALKLGARHITPEIIVEWQDQARLVTAIPGLRGGHAQLLTGAGLRSIEAIADASPDDLCARVLAFAATSAGQRILRDGDAPDIERIKGWIDGAATALAA